MTKTNKKLLLDEIRMQHLNENEWVSLEEASSNCIYSKKQIQKLAEKGNERIGTVKINNTVLYSMKDILQYASNHQKKPILSPVWDAIEPLNDEVWYPLLGYDKKYFITNKLRVMDASNGQILTPQPHKDKDGRLTGYLSVTLMKNGKGKIEKIHRLVGKTQCPNAFNYNIFHHINNDKYNGLYDNSPSNILPVVNEYEHQELHRLLDSDKKEYKKMVDKIKRRNKQKVYKIPDLDFPNTEHFNYWMIINEKGYKQYKKCGDVPLDCILQEIAEAI